MPSYRSSIPTNRPDFVEPGDYTVEIIKAEETVSGNTNDMIKLRLKVVPEGAIFTDNLVFVESAYWKIDAFRASIGETVLLDENIDLQADDLIGKQGRARLIVGEYNGRKRNEVAAWIVPTTPKSAASTPPTSSKKDDDDDLPF